jgi:hypothetical protein
LLFELARQTRPRLNRTKTGNARTAALRVNPCPKAAPPEPIGALAVALLLRAPFVCVSIQASNWHEIELKFNIVMPVQTARHLFLFVRSTAHQIGNDVDRWVVCIVDTLQCDREGLITLYARFFVDGY